MTRRPQIIGVLLAALSAGNVHCSESVLGLPGDDVVDAGFSPDRQPPLDVGVPPVAEDAGQTRDSGLGLDAEPPPTDVCDQLCGHAQVAIETSLSNTMQTYATVSGAQCVTTDRALARCKATCDEQRRAAEAIAGAADVSACFDCWLQIAPLLDVYKGYSLVCTQACTDPEWSFGTDGLVQALAPENMCWVFKDGLPAEPVACEYTPRPVRFTTNLPPTSRERLVEGSGVVVGVGPALLVSLDVDGSTIAVDYAESGIPPPVEVGDRITLQIRQSCLGPCSVTVTVSNQFGVLWAAWSRRGRVFDVGPFLVSYRPDTCTLGSVLEFDGCDIPFPGVLQVSEVAVLQPVEVPITASANLGRWTVYNFDARLFGPSLCLDNPGTQVAGVIVRDARAQ